MSAYELFISLFAIVLGINASEYKLWYNKPASHESMNEGLPIGNGRLGGFIYGNTGAEKIIINEESLWTGDDNPSGNYDTMGAYQYLGDLLINLTAHTNYANYQRELDIGDAIARISYESNGIKYSREYFVSHPSNVLVAHFTADKTKGYSGKIMLDDSHNGTVIATNNVITSTGSLNNGLKYEWQATVISTGGTTQVNGSAVDIKEVDSFMLIISAATNYVMDSTNSFRSTTSVDTIVSTTARNASQLTFNNLKSDHINDFHSLFNRVTLDLGNSSSAQSALTTDKRKVAAFTSFDPDFEELLFQYGRYLLISSSRPGNLPANLQGIWNQNNDPPWHCDYHVNINIQMNYWPAEVANLAECHLPLFNLIQSQLELWRKTTKASTEMKTPNGNMSSRGFSIRTSHNIYGGMGWNWDKTANAWYMQHFFEHYAFSLNKTYLTSVAYPVMKEIVEFWDDHLKETNGTLVVPMGWSPEHGSTEDGVSYSQEIVWDLFDNYVKAADVLGVDKTYRDRIEGLRDKLHVPGVGSWGQLLEWMTEIKNDSDILDTKNDHHRHTSHLFAVYPGHQISYVTAPKLADAAKVSLDARGIDPSSDVREWSFAWRSALYARLRDGEQAYHMYQQFFLDRNSCLNLFGLHPPMQIDGNFGVTAAVAEMLVQSQSDEIELMPAIPKVWKTGSVKALRARGGFEVDIEWSDNALKSAVIRSVTGSNVRVKYQSIVKELNLTPGMSITLNESLQSS